MHDDTEIDHPSFGFIRASRVSGHTSLFDSALMHQHYITLTIGHAVQHRNMSRNWNYPKEEYITIAMSEAQFATFITSMNVGEGAPCTLTRVMGKGIEAPPADINTRKTFGNELRRNIDAATKLLQQAQAHARMLVDKKKATLSELRDLQNNITAAQRELVDSAPFILHQFAESVETLTQQAKADINAHVVMSGQRLLKGPEEHE